MSQRQAVLMTVVGMGVIVVSPGVPLELFLGSSLIDPSVSNWCAIVVHGDRIHNLDHGSIRVIHDAPLASFIHGLHMRRSSQRICRIEDLVLSEVMLSLQHR